MRCALKPAVRYPAPGRQSALKAEKMTKSFLLIPALMAFGLTGCVNLAPDNGTPASPTPQQWPQGEAYAPLPAQADLLPQWRAVFTDAKLQKVIELALANNRDLRTAALNVEKARAAYGVTRSAEFPSINATGSNAAAHTAGTVNQTGVGRTGHNYTAQLAMAAFELDFFSRVRNMSEAALQSYLATEDAQRSSQSAIIAQTAMAWHQLGADREQLALQRRLLKSQEESYKLIQSSFEIGAASKLDLEQARTTMEAARANIVSYIRAVAQDKNALDLLCGSTVGEELLPEGLPSQAMASTVPVGLPGEVLLKRPDILAAERALRAADANIGVARAAFFPRVTLVAGAGSAGLHLSDLFDAHSGMWSFTPSISLPIFNGGLNKANLEVAKVEQRIAVADYEKAIQVAFKEVSNSLAQVGTADRELEARQAYTDAADQAYQLSDISYKAGAVSYSDVLVAQRAMVQAHQVLINTRLSKVSGLITLYQALGGGSDLEKVEENK